MSSRARQRRPRAAARASRPLERDVQRTITDLASLCGWEWYHTHDSRRSPAGFLDLVLVHEARGEIIFWEVKREGEKPTESQEKWIRILRAAGQEARVVRPEDWPHVEGRLTGTLQRAT